MSTITTLGSVQDIAVGLIKVNPLDARKVMTRVDELAESFERLGQLVPILVRQLEGSENYLLISGHRRLAAAEGLGWTSIGAIVASTSSEAHEALQGLAENTSRVDLTPSDLADAVGRLAGLEVSDEEIAKALSIRDHEVKAAKALSAAPKEIRTKAKKLADQHPLTIIQQAALATYADVKKDLATIEYTLQYQPARLDHAIAEIELRHKRERQMKEIKERLGATPILKNFDWHGPPIEHEPIVNLTTSAGKKLTLATHKTCPGHAAMITAASWSSNAPTAQYWCTNWKANGHKLSAKPERTFSRHLREEPVKVDTAAEAANRALEAARAEAWEAATSVRYEWARQHARHRLDAAAKRFVLVDILDNGLYSEGRSTAKDLSVDKAFCALLERLIDEHEDTIDGRRLSAADKDYLIFLESQGYVLSEVEKQALG
jgi:ParB family chromosome partitioning protein